ncbi:FHA domain-containing protein [Myxococcota bacterium]
MALTVAVRTGDTAPPLTLTFDAPRIVIGRGKGCDVRLPDPSVSHRHASLRQQGTAYVVVDEDSTNGTFVGQVRLPPQTPHVVRSGDLIRVGRIWLEVRLEQSLATRHSQLNTQEIALALVADALRAEGEACRVKLTVVEGPDSGAHAFVPEHRSPLVVGRASSCGLVLANADASRRHCEVFRSGIQLMVRDLGSKNGTRLGDEVVDPGNAAPWRNGQRLVIGLDCVEYQDAVAEALAELERAADERMRPDEPVAAPAGTQKEPEEPERTDKSSVPPPPPIGGSQAPVAGMPSTSRWNDPSRKRGWTGTDWLVALFAVVVLGVSIVGLYWLFPPE